MTRTRSLLLAGTSHVQQRVAVSRVRYGKPMRDEAGHPAPTPTPDPTPTPAPDSAPAPEAAPTPEDAFAAAFASETAPPAAVPTPTPDPAPAPAPAAAPTPAPAPDPSASPVPTPATAEDILKGLTEALKQPAPAAPAPTPEPTPVEQASMYSPEEQEALTAYDKDWPEVSRAETLKRRAEYHDLLAFTFKEVNRYTQPLFDAVKAMGNTLHTTELKGLVPDYTPLVEADVNAWIETQPSYLQAGMKGVMQGGTSDEVADLIGRYRAASGVAPASAPAPSPAPASGGAPASNPPKTPATPVKTELSEAAKQAAASLAPVGGERSQVPVGEDQQDFDSAFAKFAAAGG